MDKRPGGNFTHPTYDMRTGETVYVVYVNWVPLDKTYELAVDAENALHEAMRGKFESDE